MFTLGTRLELQDVLEAIIGSENVYFQPPSGLTIQYPCFVYQRDTASSQYADSVPYRTTKKYQVTYIDKNPDSDGIFNKMMQLPMCRHDRFYRINNLNHDVFNLYF